VAYEFRVFVRERDPKALEIVTGGDALFKANDVMILDRGYNQLAPLIVTAQAEGGRVINAL
jgi:hypothetical protein